MVLMVSARAATSPLASTVIFWDRSPLDTAVVTSASPRTGPAGPVDPPGHPTLAADDLGHPDQLLGAGRVDRHQLVEDAGDLAHDPAAPGRQPGGEVAVLRGPQRPEQVVQRLLAGRRGASRPLVAVPV